MGETARRMGCEPLASDCCQTPGERTSPSPQQVVPLAPLPSPPGSVAAMAVEPLFPDPSREEPGPAAVIQGIGLHTLLSVFLI